MKRGVVRTLRGSLHKAASFAIQLNCLPLPHKPLLSGYPTAPKEAHKHYGMKNRDFTLRTRLRSFGHAFRGIRLLVSSEPNARIHCLAAVGVCVAGVWLGLSGLEWVAVAIVVGAVLAAEAMNSAIEALADLVSPGYNEAIKRTKDLAAGAVLLTAISAAVTGLIIFLPKVWLLITN